jgi:hypothetical protein
MQGFGLLVICIIDARPLILLVLLLSDLTLRPLSITILHSRREVA